MSLRRTGPVLANYFAKASKVKKAMGGQAGTVSFSHVGV
jgi:hypothetical protein